MRRKKPLRADPEKVREFLRRGRENASLTRSDGLSRGKGPAKAENSSDRPRIARPKKPKPPEGPLTPARWRAAVLELDRRHCVGCGAGPFSVTDSRYVWQAHHPIAKQKLRKRGLHDRVWDPQNGVVLCTRCHEGHESRIRPVPAGSLPRRCRRFAYELGTWAIDVLDHAHPAAGTSGGREE